MNLLQFLIVTNDNQSGYHCDFYWIYWKKNLHCSWSVLCSTIKQHNKMLVLLSIFVMATHLSKSQPITYDLFM